MSETLRQRIQDSEDTYLNTSFWEIHPMYVLIQNGETEQLEEKLYIQLERFPAGRITRDERKQLEYLTVSLVNTFMIAAIQGGVYPPEANAAADQALRKLSHLRNVTELPALVHDAAAKLCIQLFGIPDLFDQLDPLLRILSGFLDGIHIRFQGLDLLFKLFLLCLILLREHIEIVFRDALRSPNPHTA